MCPLESFENCTVDLLIEPNTRIWNEGLIDGLFVEEDAELIKKIPLSQAATEDSLYWPYSTSGHYTCKSGYMFLKQESEMEASQQVPPIHDKQLWKKIWQLQVPPKIKNFRWRACCNVLPTKQALLKRKVTADSICERCRSAVEEFVHAVWSCPELGDVWGVDEEWCFRSEVEFTDVKELLSWLIAEGKSLELFAYTAWMVWTQRNKVHVTQQVVLLHQLAEQAKQKLNQFRADRQNSEVQVTDSNVGGSRWSCPQDGWVKINLNGAVFSESNQSRVGVVFRDNNGAVLASCSEKLHQAYKPDEVEALAALKAISLARDLGFRKVILEGDSVGLIKALKSAEDSLSPTGLLVDYVK